MPVAELAGVQVEVDARCGRHPQLVETLMRRAEVELYWVQKHLAGDATIDVQFIVGA